VDVSGPQQTDPTCHGTNIMNQIPISVPSRRKNVFVVHGRNTNARQAMFDFLRSIELFPIEWSKASALTGEASPIIEKILDAAFEHAQAVVVLFTPDEIVTLRSEYSNGDTDPDLTAAAQSRPNVFFEAGMAMGRDPQRTVLVELGTMRKFSDILGRHVLRIDNDPRKRHNLALRLASAGCDIDITGQDWYTSGNFVIPPDLREGPALSPRSNSPVPGGVNAFEPNIHIRRHEIR
jgi:predicted nucleotide-binding protein